MLGDLNKKEIQDVLEHGIIGRIGCRDADKIYVVPVSYMAGEGCVYCHSMEGMKINMMRRSPKVCFEVEEMKNYTNWRTVIAWGNYEEIKDAKEITELRDYFSDQMLIMKASKTAMPPHSAQERSRDVKPDFTKSIFYKIVFTELSGRFEKEI